MPVPPVPTPPPDPPPTIPTPIDPLLPNPPSIGGSPEVRIVPRVPKYPLGPPYIVEPGLPPHTFVGPDGTIVVFDGVPPLVYTPLQPMDPPHFLPGDPIPPGMPPAWNGGSISRPRSPGELRPPYPWEPLMINPRWNPSEAGGGWPTYVPNPNYDPSYPIPPGQRTPVPRPGPKIPPDTVPIVPDGSIGITVPETRPQGYWPSIVGKVRFVLGAAGAVAAVGQLFTNSDHYDALKVCMTSFLAQIGYDNSESFGPSEADQTVEALNYFNQSGDAASLTNLVNQIVQRACAKASAATLAGIKLGSPCAAFGQNVIAAAQLCQCKNNPPDQTAVAAGKAALLQRIKNYQDSDYAMRVDMETRKAAAQASVQAYGDSANPNYSPFCSGKWNDRVNAIEALILARTYVVTWFDLAKNVNRMDLPTCENRLSPAACLAYLQALSAAMDASVAAFQAASNAWDAFKAANGDMANIGCPILTPTNTTG